MSNFNVSPRHVSATSRGLPHPEPLLAPITARTVFASALPRPVSANVADSGRIRFGAGMRNPSK